ncbi:MAG TPA: sigma-70 family RNA polymerase sigma factor [Candidatus Acidoferrales bacterium]|jgi:RNA polymerase sigma-70 factor (ECF subfamily)|nr:sigma-70 family RNA polymerase sigma factor [Candidatus Acidoferrales bacterium]
MPLPGFAIALSGDGIASSAEDRAGRLTARLDERALVERAQGGDRLAFEELVHRFDRDVLRLALNLTRRTEDARDVYQEAFLKAYKNLHRFRFECSFYTWLYRIVTNVCLDQMRRRNSRPEDQAPEIADADDSPRDFFEQQRAPGSGMDPERRLMGQEIGNRISAAMDRLSPRERVIFEMKHHQGLKLRAIGELLGTTEETVKNSLFRATRKLRVQLVGLL